MTILFPMMMKIVNNVGIIVTKLRLIWLLSVGVASETFTTNVIFPVVRSENKNILLSDMSALCKKSKSAHELFLTTKKLFVSVVEFT